LRDTTQLSETGSSPDAAQLAMTRQVVAALRRIIHAVDLHSRALVQRYGLTGPQLVVLRELVEGPSRTVGELAQAVHLSQATVTGIVDRLERKGLVHRQRSAHDKRRVMVLMTDRAGVVLAGAPPLLQEHFIDGFGRLPEWERTQILSSLQRVVALMERPALGVAPVLMAASGAESAGEYAKAPAEGYLDTLHPIESSSLEDPL